MQNQNTKPRAQWDEDEIYDGRAKTAEIDILVFAPGEWPRPLTIPNTLSAMREVVGGTITCFQIGIARTIGVCHDEGILLGFPPCRYIAATGALIFGPFFVAGDGVNMHSLNTHDIAEATRVLGPLLTRAQVLEAIRREEETIRQIEEWNKRYE